MLRQQLERFCHSDVQSIPCRALRDGGAVHSHNLQEQDSQRGPPLRQLRAQPWWSLCCAHPAVPRFTASALSSAQTLLPSADQPSTSQDFTSQSCCSCGQSWERPVLLPDSSVADQAAAEGEGEGVLLTWQGCGQQDAAVALCRRAARGACARRLGCAAPRRSALPCQLAAPAQRSRPAGARRTTCCAPALEAALPLPLTCPAGRYFHLKMASTLQKLGIQVAAQLLHAMAFNQQSLPGASPQ